MKMSTKIMLFAIIMVIASVSIVSGLVMVENSAYNNKVSYDRLMTASMDLEYKIDELQEQSRNYAIMIAQNHRLIEAIEKNNTRNIQNVLDELNDTLMLSQITVTDSKGKVLFRQHEPGNYGDIVISETTVKEALDGVSSATIAPDNAENLSSKSSAPIENASGRVIGTVSAGYVLENSKVLDELKELHNTELMIFSGSSSIGTTILHDGARGVGYSLDGDVQTTVLEQGQSYTGKTKIYGVTYVSIYKPLLNSGGYVVGAIFAGLSVSEAQAAFLKTLTYILIALPLIILVSGFLLRLFVNSNIRRPMLRLMQATDSLANGQLDIKIDESGRKDEVALLEHAMQEMVFQLKNYISDISFVLNAIAENDLTISSSVSYVGDFIPIEEALESIVDSMNATLSIVKNSAQQFNESAYQLSGSAQTLAQGATEQAEVIGSLTQSVHKISGDVENNAENVRLTKRFVEEAASGIENGNYQMRNMMTAMDNIKDSSLEINKIIKTIDNIAFQTNILALNAAVESARAGAAGKGFAVVADEVRNLASRSAEAARQTSVLIGRAINVVEEGYVLADNTAKVFEEVNVKAENAQTSIMEIDKASTKQAQEIQQVRSNLNQISDVVQMNTAASQETAAASEELLSQSELLNQQITKFKLSEIDTVHAEKTDDTNKTVVSVADELVSTKYFN